MRQLGIFLLFCLIMRSIHAQTKTVTIHGSGYTIQTEKKVVNGLDFIEATKSGNTRATKENFVRSADGYTPTVFTAQELINFTTKKTISSLGKPGVFKYKGVQYNYVKKGTTLIVLRSNKNEVGVLEIFNGTRLLSADGEINDEDIKTDYDACTSGCDIIGLNCLYPGDGDVLVTGEAAEACGREVTACYKRCKDYFAMQHAPRPSRYTIPLPGIRL